MAVGALETAASKTVLIARYRFVGLVSSGYYDHVNIFLPSRFLGLLPWVCHDID